MRYKDIEKRWHTHLVQWIDGNWYEIFGKSGAYFTLSNDKSSCLLAFPDEIVASVKKG